MRFILSKRILSYALAISCMLGATTSCFATNGYFLIGYGAKARAMGGAGVAMGHDSLSAAANPATFADVKLSAMQVDIGADFFIPRRAVSHNADILGDEYRNNSGANLFLIPAMGGIYKFNRRMTIGMAAVGAGSNTRYNQSVPECEDNDPNTVGSTFFNYNCNGSPTIGINLIQMQMLPTIAYKLTKQHAIGASLAIGIQTFRAYGLGSFGAPGSPLNFSGDRDNLTNRGNDWSYGLGFRLGWLSHFFDRRLSVGLNYSSRVYMTKFDKYSGLFAEQGGFDIPENYAIGLALRPTDKLTFLFDVQKTRYSSVRSIGNPGPDQADPFNFFPTGFGCVATTANSGGNTCAMGENNGLGFGWQDQMVYKAGIQYEYNPTWTFRLGFNYGKAPIPTDQRLFALLAPAVVEKHATVGLSYKMSKNVEWGMSYVYAFKNTLKGKSVFYPQGINTIDELEKPNAAMSMYQHSLGITFSYLM